MGTPGYSGSGSIQVRRQDLTRVKFFREVSVWRDHVPQIFIPQSDVSESAGRNVTFLRPICLICGSRTARGRNTAVSHMARGLDKGLMSISRAMRPRRPLFAPALRVLAPVLDETTQFIWRVTGQINLATHRAGRSARAI